MRSLRIEYSACNNSARNSISGAIDGRPIREYNPSNKGDSCRKASSHILRKGRNG